MPVQLRAGETDVIDPFEQHNVSYPWQRQGVPVEASQGTDAEASAEAKSAVENTEAIAQQPVTGYARIDHCQLRTFVRLSQTTDKIARPIVVRIHCGPIAIREGVSKRHQQTLRRLSRNEYSTHQN